MPNMIGLLLPLLMVVGGVAALLYLRPKMLSHVQEMKFMTTSTFDDLQNLFATMQAEGLGDSFRQYVELKGQIACDQPIHTPFSGRDVAYCASTLYTVSRIEEQYRDKDGNLRTRTSKKEELLTDERGSDVIILKSDSSDMRIALDVSNGCKLDVPETFDRFEPVNNLTNYSYFRNFRHRSANLLGYHMREKTIPLNQPLYVLGEAYKEGSQIHIGKPLDKEKPFLVSTKSEDQMVGSYETNAKIALFGGIAAIAVGVLLLVFNLIK